MYGFCKCGGLMMPVGERLKCRKCGATQSQAKDNKALVKTVRETKKVAVLEEDKPNLPTIEHECDKCGNATSYFWVVQTRASDEPPTRFFRCTKCNHTWREYS